MDVKKLLEGVQQGSVTIDDALLLLKKEPYVDIDYAKVDMHRELVRGCGEVIYGEGKTAEQISGIIKAMRERGQENILITRLSEEKAQGFKDDAAFTYYPEARLAICGQMKEADGIGKVAVITAGTSDLPIAEEAALTAEFLGNETIRIYDVGVAGLHRLLSKLDLIMTANVIIVIAGMEGALASVVGGLVQSPVIAVPSSVGYGASFGGITALLSMLNSCSGGVSVVNIDNGFGAAFQASLINHPYMEEKK